MTLSIFIAGVLTGIALPVMAYAAYQGYRIRQLRHRNSSRWTRA